MGEPKGTVENARGGTGRFLSAVLIVLMLVAAVVLFRSSKGAGRHLLQGLGEFRWESLMDIRL